MDKGNKKTITVVAIAVIIITIVSSQCLAASVQTSLLPSGDPPQWQIRVTEDYTVEMTLTRVKWVSQIEVS